MVDLILFPSDFFDTKRVDADLRQEYEAALSTGLFEVALFSYEQWFHHGKLVVTGAPKEMHTAIYRGWMMQPEQYERFYQLLLEQNISLITKPEAYRLLHIFPNVYDLLAEDTAKMLMYPLRAEIPVDELKRHFSRFMVKDYVKSVKGTEFPRFFDETITQNEFDRWMEVFYRYRGGLLTGGICIKEYLSLKHYGERTNEYRVFYINHIPATVCRNSGQGNYTPLPPRELIEKYSQLDSPYYTVDYAELADGTWKVIEAGDGSVSGLSDHQDAKQYFRALFQCFK